MNKKIFLVFATLLVGCFVINSCGSKKTIGVKGRLSVRPAYRKDLGLEQIGDFVLDMRHLLKDPISDQARSAKNDKTRQDT